MDYQLTDLILTHNIKKMRIAQMPDMGAMPMADPGAGAAPEAAAPAFKIIHSPLDSLGKILADLDLKTFLENNFGSDPADLAQKIWVMYGGNENQLGEGKKGAREDKPISDDPMQQDSIQDEEYNNTRESRWQRLPEGVSIDEITTPEAIEKTLTSGGFNLAKTYAKPAAAFTLDKWHKAANIADQNGNYKFADKLLEIIKDVYPL
jgi:hypothetical protein